MCLRAGWVKSIFPKQYDQPLWWCNLKEFLVNKLESPIMIQHKCGRDNRVYVLEDKLRWPRWIEDHMMWVVVVVNIGYLDEQRYFRISSLVIVKILFLSIVVKVRDKEEDEGIHSELILYVWRCCQKLFWKIDDGDRS